MCLYALHDQSIVVAYTFYYNDYGWAIIDVLLLMVIIDSPVLVKYVARHSMLILFRHNLLFLFAACHELNVVIFHCRTIEHEMLWVFRYADKFATKGRMIQPESKPIFLRNTAVPFPGYCAFLEPASANSGLLCFRCSHTVVLSLRPVYSIGQRKLLKSQAICGCTSGLR